MGHFSPRVEWMGMVFDIPTIIMMVVTSLLVFLLVVGLTRRLTAGVPGGGQNVMEWVVDFVSGITQNFMEPKTAAKFVTLGLTLFLYIFLGNQLGLVFNVNTVHHELSPSFKDMLTVSGTPEAAAEKAKIIEEELHSPHGVVVAWWKSPTATASVTFTLALLVLIYAHILGIRKNPGEWFKSTFLNPIHILEDFVIKPLTLPLRLFGNIFAGEVLIAFLLGVGLVGTVPLFVWLGYSVFVGSVQAFIFVTLTMVYISQKVNDHH
ncbi:F0F1 ATP synthase subunit A [Brevibacillus sp. SYP-B805]|uniref:F0F1 ATP synthase subunit A n=1 Tax=Brevibacillus sp. SYP-B805 TaxID=1578199 RepID=UPI0013EDAA9F|nr:F0F1 ATP synthase subunit A [Brevibacillus sp. SYP-B805]NGQ95556.1 F0F1 ATP synthase subunit A [Brevibacillus sp. SYP-B805]